MPKSTINENDFLGEAFEEMERTDKFFSSAKNYVLDTSVILQDPKAIFAFEENNVIITSVTLQELDRQNSYGHELDFALKEITDNLKMLMVRGDLNNGVALNGGGHLIIVSDGIDERNLPVGFSIKSTDNKIISMCVSLKQKHPNSKFTLITNKNLMAVNASVCGLRVESYKNGSIRSTGYTGYAEIRVNDEMIINELFQGRSVPESEIVSSIAGAKPDRLYPNEFVLLKYGEMEALTILSHGNFKLLPELRESVYGIRPLNIAQRCLLYALCAPVSEIPLVIINGPAGTGKTMLSCAAGLEAIDCNISNRLFNKMFITRNNIMSDKDFGYLPGTLEEKMEPLLMPFVDSISKLIRMKKSKQKSNVTNIDIQVTVQQLFDKGMIDILPLSHIRGRSLSDSYIIVDEAQNAPQLLMRDILTRPGTGTKLIISGDPAQVDNALLDSDNNGLVLAIERMKDSPYAALITFDENECNRSPLAADALNRLNDIRKD